MRRASCRGGRLGGSRVAGAATRLPRIGQQARSASRPRDPRLILHRRLCPWPADVLGPAVVLADAVGHLAPVPADEDARLAAGRGADQHGPAAVLADAVRHLAAVPTDEEALTAAAVVG